MGKVNCPVCRGVRHIADHGDYDRCWECGCPIPVDHEGKYAEFDPKFLDRLRELHTLAEKEGT